MASNNDQNFTSSSAQPTMDLQTAIEQFWQQASEEITKLGHADFKVQDLPLARIKKIMKLDEDVKMISAEAPVLFAKAAEIFIRELSLRAWIHTEDNKRRTLQRNDIATAISKFDQFDFLIDIVPRDELKPTKREEGVQRTSMLPDQVQYYFQLAQQHQAALQQNQPQTQPQPQPAQSVPAPAAQVVQQVQLGTAAQQSTNDNQAAQVIQIQQPQQPAQQVQVAQPAAAPQQQAQTTQVFMQIVGANGEVQNVPVQLPQSQLQSIQQQLHGKQAGQPIIIQTGSQGQEQTETQQFSSTQSMYQVPQPTVQQVFVQQAVTGEGDHAEVVHEGAG